MAQAACQQPAHLPCLNMGWSGPTIMPLPGGIRSPEPGGRCGIVGSPGGIMSPLPKSPSNAETRSSAGAGPLPAKKGCAEHHELSNRRCLITKQQHTKAAWASPPVTLTSGLRVAVHRVRHRQLQPGTGQHSDLQLRAR